MRTALLTPLASPLLALLTLLPLNPHAQTASPRLPQGGAWELQRTERGPFGERSSSVPRVCLDSAALQQAPEQTLIRASNAKADTPRCEFTGLVRDGVGSSWGVQCESPRGKLKGTGRSTLSLDAADLQQELEANTPMGSIRVRTTVRARRLGDC